MAIRTGRLRLGPDEGRMLLRTRRTGIGSTVGHDLAIEVTDWSVELDIRKLDRRMPPRRPTSGWDRWPCGRAPAVRDR
ncbi:hypothetical protein ONA91_26005 [Micromonospora sp. DR5-3]|uniref:hypothetical protein n=1 Tax=unclassified Micromonospora TaxID=2617518 RepID=UPI001651D880|nr:MULTISPECIES: hypothetical protein [unclassified Micromonospora]MCW3817909.1 hypothetical protein [Micromonospora sp. DR5-3]